MIGRIRGELIETDGATALVDAGGVGYEISVPHNVLAQLPLPGAEVTLLTRQIFREDGQSLYGFMTSFQRRLFDILLEVKGCGPKVALSLLGAVGEQGIVNAVTLEDPKGLVAAPGVGPRLAERIILETKDKIMQDAAIEKIGRAVISRRPVQEDELVEALLGLGYRRTEAESAAGMARDNADSLPEQIRYATQKLRKS